MGNDFVYEHNGKQSDSTRKELLIALQYLLDNCYDSSHTSKTIDLVKYAEGKGAYIDRRRANSIFDTLVEFTNSKNNSLPYKVSKVSNKPRYYIQKTFFTNKEIESIALAIDDYSNIDKDKANKYMNSFLEKVTNVSHKDAVINKVNKKVAESKHISNSKDSIFSVFENIMDNEYKFSFRIKNPSALRPEDFTRYYKDLVLAIRRKEWLSGLIYTVIRKYNTLVIYLPDPYYAAIVVKVDNIELNEDYTIHELWAAPTYELRNSKYHSIDEYQELYYKGQVGVPIPVKFKFWIGFDEYQLNKLKTSFEEYFKKPMEYELVERKVDIKHHDGTIETKTALDAVVKVTCNYSSFKNWYWSSGAYESTVILSPHYWNNRLLQLITERFKTRMEKYGVKPISHDAATINTIISNSDKIKKNIPIEFKYTNEEKAGN